MKRAKLADDNETIGNYFARPADNVDFVSSGSALLDCVLGGGYALGRIVNIVGDKSTGKTLLAIEAAANFAKQFPDGDIFYREVEAAFDEEYAAALGMPIEHVDFGDKEYLTVEDIFEDLEDIVKERKKKKIKEPAIYVLDSLDALSDRGELSRDIDEGTYGAEKAKKMSQLFRRLNSELSGLDFCVFIISQVRDNIGVTIGKKTKRSGGRALDFYASQVIFLQHLGEIKRTINKVERTVGIKIKVKCEKNKVGLPFRVCEFPIHFGYGIDDLEANMNWLLETGYLDRVGLTNDKKDIRPYIKGAPDISDDEFLEMSRKSANAVKELWVEIEDNFLPNRKKY